MAEVKSTFQLKPGDQAPGFVLPDSEGNQVGLGGAMGAKGLLVIFACNHCPFVIHLAKELGNFSRETGPLGIGTVAINSNDIEKFPQDGPEEMKTFAAESDWEFPYLLDESQEIAHAYGAACTPDFFLFDTFGRLAYTGQFDETRPRQEKKAHGADLRNAVQKMLAGEKIENPQPSSGCNIKWKPGNEPG